MRRLDAERSRIEEELRRADEEARSLEIEAARLAEALRARSSDRDHRERERGRRQVDDARDDYTDRRRFDPPVPRRDRDRDRTRYNDDDEDDRRQYDAPPPPPPRSRAMSRERARYNETADRRRFEEEVERRALEKAEAMVGRRPKAADADVVRGRVSRIEEEARTRHVEDESDRRARVRVSDFHRRPDDDDYGYDDGYGRRPGMDAGRAGGRGLGPKDVPPDVIYRQGGYEGRDRFDGGGSDRFVDRRADEAGSYRSPAPAPAPASTSVSPFAGPRGRPEHSPSATAPAAAPPAAAGPAPAVASSNFSVFEVGAPQGSLGLVLLPYAIRIPILAKMVTIFCAIVEQVRVDTLVPSAALGTEKHPSSNLRALPCTPTTATTQSKNTSAIQRGDIVMSVGDMTLVGDEEQSPGGMNHCNACVQILSQAPHPRRIRFYRSRSVNANENASSVPAEEAIQIAPIIFNGGDGGRRLMEALKGLGQISSAPQDSARAAPPSAPAVAEPTYDMTMMRGVIQQAPPGVRSVDHAPRAAAPDPFKPPAGFEPFHKLSVPHGFGGSRGADTAASPPAAPLPSSASRAAERGSDTRTSYLQGTLKPLSTSYTIEGEHVTGKSIRDKRQNDLESKRGSRVFEHIFRDKQNKPLGLGLVATQLSVETHAGRRQTFWTVLVSSNSSGAERIQVGDVLLYAHANLCVLDATQARSGVEFTRAVAALLSAAAHPRAVRFARLESLHDDAEDGMLQTFYALGKVCVMGGRPPAHQRLTSRAPRPPLLCRRPRAT